MKKKKQKKMSKKAAIPAVLALSVTLGGLAPTFPGLAGPASVVSVQAEGLSKQEIVKAFLQSKVMEKTKSAATGDQFKIISEEADSETGTYHVRTVEQYKGIPIYGSGQTVALDANNNVYASFGNVTQKLARTIIPTEAAIEKKEAENIAKASVASEIGVDELKTYDGLDTELTIYPYKGKYYLTYLVKVSTSTPAPGYFHYFVDATNGEVVNHFNAMHEVDPTSLTVAQGRGLNVFGKMQYFPVGKDAATGTSYLYGGSIAGGTLGNPNIVPLATFDARRMPETSFILLSALFGFTGFEINTKSSSNYFYDPAAVSAHTNADKINKYYQGAHKRNGIDGKGTPFISSVHIGSKWNNAAWNGKQMLYGDGDGVTLGSLAGGLDVAGHEITHGVITNTANLTYQGESGAINESLADIFGEISEMYSSGSYNNPSEWEMGEDIYTPNKAGDGGLRSLKDPRTKTLPAAYEMRDNRYPDHYDDRYTGELDKGGVHINSSINNKAAYLISEGGTHNGVTVTGLGASQTGAIFYSALTKYLTPSSGFKEMREAAIQATRDKFPDKNGQPSVQTQTVINAYDAVGAPAE
ncbi:M4 family metallopeptidase [Rossellomorea sp. DA94]|uniref:M4 family metallopeptidase n=1 Tax=Rossellomorea sp. DA94 TaxID=3038653 RepID=UPI00244ADFF2|nr:M4 family metallopeptidase [Rossellomorea sp. DA94]WGG45330.1 M4 family metallopeptidase [Rossellomorea sp. DA94]